MTAIDGGARDKAFESALRAHNVGAHRHGPDHTLSAILNGWVDMIAPCPWSAHIGLSAVATHTDWHEPSAQHTTTQRGGSSSVQTRQPLYTPAERLRRDKSPWTIVQGVLAPIQFLAFAVSLVLIFRYMATGQGYGLATASILVKTALLYTIMITGSIWEKVVFGKWLFARAFFWEDVFSFVVLTLQTLYLAMLFLGWGTPTQQMMVAIAAYATYVINAAQFLLKLRAARLDAAGAELPGLAA